MGTQLFVTDNPIDNERYGCYRFNVELETVMHGFAGYFDTVLYKDAVLSELIVFVRLYSVTSLTE